MVIIPITCPKFPVSPYSALCFSYLRSTVLRNYIIFYLYENFLVVTKMLAKMYADKKRCPELHILGNQYQKPVNNETIRCDPVITLRAWLCCASKLTTE